MLEPDGYIRSVLAELYAKLTQESVISTYTAVMRVLLHVCCSAI